MALGSKTLIALAAASILMGQTVELHHAHWWKSGAGSLVVSDDGLSWTELKEKDHSRTWRWEDIQQLELTSRRIRVLTYEDIKWQGSRDREYTFTRVPEEFVSGIIGTARQKLGPKLIAAVAEPVTAPLWQIPVKLHRRTGGSEGTLIYAGDRLVYSSPDHEQSRSWAISDIETVSSAGPYELTIFTQERAGWTRRAREFRFQPKTPISEQQYQRLWKAVQSAQGFGLPATPAHTDTSK
jgi:hypothetical protein